MSKKLTHDEAVARIEAKFGDKIIVIGRYNSWADPLLVRCQCGVEFTPSLSNLMKGQSCRRCGVKRMAKSKMLSHEEVVARIKKISVGKITVIDQYKGALGRLTARCKFGHQWTAQASELLRGHGCRKCTFISTAEKERLSHDEAMARIEKIFGGKITVVGQYKNKRSKLSIRCQCTHQWEALPSNLFTGRGCPKCAE
jgi:hypothetical protein